MYHYIINIYSILKRCRSYSHLYLIKVVMFGNMCVKVVNYFPILTNSNCGSIVRWQPIDPSSSQISLPQRTKKYLIVKNVTTDRSIRMSQFLTIEKKNIRYYDTAVLVDNLLEWRICISSIKCISGGKRRTMLDSKIKCSATYLQCKLIEETLTPICVFIRHIGNIAFLRNSAVWY